MKFLSQFLYTYVPTRYMERDDGARFYLATVMYYSTGGKDYDGYYSVDGIAQTRYRAQREAFQAAKKELWDRCLYFSNNKLGAEINGRC